MSVPVINFRVRKDNVTTPTLQGYISIYGEEASKFSLQIKIKPPLRWNQEQQRFTNKSAIAESNNSILDKIRAKLNQCFIYMSRIEAPINCRTLKVQFLKDWRPDRKRTTLLELYKEYYLVQQNRLKRQEILQKTLDKYEKCSEHLKSFISKTYKLGDIDIFLVDSVFGKQFFDFLSKGNNKICDEGTAKRYLSFVNNSLELAINNRRIKENPLKDVKPRVKRKSSKKIIIKEKEQLSIYNLADLTKTERHVADISTFLFYTCFDYCDYIDHFSKQKHIVVIDGKRAIQKPRYKERKKTNPLTCTIPINNILEEILAKYEILPQYPDKTIRQIYRNLATRVGIANAQEIGTKQLRKSGGSYYVNEGVPLKIVSETILGHTRVAMSEKHYIKIDPETIIKLTSHLLQR